MTITVFCLAALAGIVGGAVIALLLLRFVFLPLFEILLWR